MQDYLTQLWRTFGAPDSHDDQVEEAERLQRDLADTLTSGQKEKLFHITDLLSAALAENSRANFAAGLALGIGTLFPLMAEE